MHRLLIVDDDEILRTGIEKNIDWKANGFEVVGTASNGRECLEMIQNCVPDIVLTDIKMPFMDGMQLAEAIYNLYPVIKIVLLTAYEDFSYAKKALGLKVCEYVMKYEDNDAIVSAVKKAAREYDKRKNDADILKKSSQLLINKFFYDLMFLNGREEAVQEQIRQLGLNMPGERFQVICVYVAPQQAEKEAENYWQQEQLRNQMGILLSACLSNEICHAYFFVARERLDILVNIEVQNGDGKILDDATLLTVIENIQNTLSVYLVLGVGNAYDGYENISKSYEEANQALTLQDVLQAPGGSPKKVVHIADVADSSHAGVLRTIKEYILGHYSDKSLSLNSIAEEVHLTPSYISTIFKKSCQVNIIDYIIEVRMKQAKELLEKTDLKFYEIAEKIGYANSQYFSVLFKKTTGMSPTEYRQSIRGRQP